jgi:septation ring formation regulator EzrA
MKSSDGEKESLRNHLAEMEKDYAELRERLRIISDLTTKVYKEIEDTKERLCQIEIENGAGLDYLLSVESGVPGDDLESALRCVAQNFCCPPPIEDE